MPGTACTRRSRSGISYLEVLLAMVILAMCIIPSARYLPGLLAQQRDLELKYRLSLIAQEKLEEAMLALESDFSARYEYGGMEDPDYRYLVDVCIPPEGQGRYATIRVLAWVDTDGNHWDDDTPEADEFTVRFDTMQSDPSWSP